MRTCEGVSAPQDRTLVGSRDLKAVPVCRGDATGGLVGGDDQNTYVHT